MAPTKSTKHRYIPIIILGIAVGVLGVGAVAFVRGLVAGGAPPSKKVVQEVHLIRPPPPPPDLPPPPPPPPEEKVDIPDPQQQPDPTPSNEPPPSEQLGLDAEGSAGGDAFGLIGNKGGRDLVGSGGSAFKWYEGVLTSQIQDIVGAELRALHGPYSAQIKFWIREDGTVGRIGLAQSTGDRERDKRIEALLSRISRLPKPPPADMPEPVNVTIRSHG